MPTVECKQHLVSSPDDQKCASGTIFAVYYITKYPLSRSRVGVRGAQTSSVIWRVWLKSEDGATREGLCGDTLQPPNKPQGRKVGEVFLTQISRWCEVFLTQTSRWCKFFLTQTSRWSKVFLTQTSRWCKDSSVS